MTLFSDEERRFAEAIAALSYENPFTPARVAGEKQALGSDFRAAFAVWSAGADVASNNPNLQRLEDGARRLVEEKRERVAAGVGSADEREVYRDVARFALYAEHGERLYQSRVLGNERGPASTFDDYERDYLRLVDAGGERSSKAERAHLFALFFQLRRAFHHIFSHILGGSLPAARLRADVWESVFTRDMRRYRRALFGRMNVVPTLILGPSGTGKELIARAIGRSLYVPFSPSTRSFDDDAAQFAAVNLSALSATLLESELFGHKKGSFTGAITDKPGYLEAVGASGAVFLDEIGELDPLIQVKLLRVLESRTFQRIGETAERRFEGKIVAATNRDLTAMMQAGSFREDLYYRLCADVVYAPTLKARLTDHPGELATLTTFLARRLVGDDEAADASAEVCAFIESELGRRYAWPGNVRELEQCVRNVLIRGSYRPALSPQASAASAPLGEGLARLVEDGQLSADDLVRHYCTRIYALTGSYEETARRLKLDRRTVKTRVDTELLSVLQQRRER